MKNLQNIIDYGACLRFHGKYLTSSGSKRIDPRRLFFMFFLDSEGNPLSYNEKIYYSLKPITSYWGGETAPENVYFEYKRGTQFYTANLSVGVCTYVKTTTEQEEREQAFKNLAETLSSLLPSPSVLTQRTPYRFNTDLSFITGDNSADFGRYNTGEYNLPVGHITDIREASDLTELTKHKVENGIFDLGFSFARFNDTVFNPFYRSFYRVYVYAELPFTKETITRGVSKNGYTCYFYAPSTKNVQRFGITGTFKINITELTHYPLQLVSDYSSKAVELTADSLLVLPGMFSGWGAMPL